MAVNWMIVFSHPLLQIISKTSYSSIIGLWITPYTKFNAVWITTYTKFNAVWITPYTKFNAVWEKQHSPGGSCRDHNEQIPIWHYLPFRGENHGVTKYLPSNDDTAPLK
jgi:hypothetical protein